MKKLNRKPGSDPRRFKPDVIESYPVDEPSGLMEFLIQAMPERKRTTIKELLKYSQVAVNRRPTSAFDAELQPGDVVDVNLTRPFHVFSNRRMQIVYEDDDIIVVNKGYGLLSIASDRVKEGTAYSLLRDYVKWNNPANKIFVVHRLDRDTSGLMMFAKTIEAKEAMQHNWNNMVLRRTYTCVVEGIVEEDSGVIKSRLKENARHEVYSAPEDEPGGQLAITRWKVLGRGHGRTLMEVELDTGRKNQIRVHMSEAGHPIVGDRRYGAGSSPIKRLALHATTLNFAHPITRQLMEFTAPVPAGFKALITSI